MRMPNLRTMTAALALIATSCSSKPSPETLCSSADTQGALKNALTEDTERFIAKHVKNPDDIRNPLLLAIMVDEARFTLITVEGYKEDIGRARCSGTVNFEGDFNAVIGPPKAVINAGGSASDNGASFPMEWNAQKLANENSIAVQLTENYANLVLILYNFARMTDHENSPKK